MKSERKVPRKVAIEYREMFVWIEGPHTDPDLTHIERINRSPPQTLNPADIPGLGVPH